MDPNLIISLISLAAAIIIPIVIYYKEGSKTKIVFFRKQFFKLYDDLTKNIPDLQITYKGMQIHSTMFSLKGIFVCSGRNDVDADDIKKGITLTTPDKQTLWHSFKIVECSNNLDINYTIGQSEVVIDFPLLKDKDYFIIEAIGESSVLKLCTDHRIKDVAKIRQKNFEFEKQIRRFTVIGLSALVLISIAFLYESELFSSHGYPNNQYEFNGLGSTDSIPIISHFDTTLNSYVPIKGISFMYTYNSWWTLILPLTLFFLVYYIMFLLVTKYYIGRKIAKLASKIQD